MAVGDINLAYASSAALTIALASLNSGTNRLTGRESSAVLNTATEYLDALIGGRITTGTSPTVDRRIEVWAYGALWDAPAYPANVTGANAGLTLVSANMKRASLRLISVILVDATSNRTYSFGPLSLAEVFGGALPTHWGVFVTHDTGVALNATPGNHNISYTPIYSTVE